MTVSDLMPIPDGKDIQLLSDWFALCERWGAENNNVDVRQDAWSALQHIANASFRDRYLMSLSSRVKALNKA
jgi:hypothetical protein